jgi:hypothetical protein
MMQPMTQLYVLGDIGGQLEIFHRVLKSLGVNDDLLLPAGMVLVQVGDVARASIAPALDSEGCIELANDLLQTNPDQYIQLMGNHEFAMIGDYYRGREGVRDSETIWDWWRQRRAQLAIGVVASDGSELMITHAGLTRGMWKDLGRPNLAGAVRLLNDRVAGNLSDVVVPGSLLTGAVNTASDVSWAEVNFELYEPWISHGDLPFAQLHGHASPYSWKLHDWWPETPKDIRSRTTIDRKRRRTTTNLGEIGKPMARWATSLDWALGDEFAQSAYELWTTPITHLIGA